MVSLFVQSVVIHHKFVHFDAIYGIIGHQNHLTTNRIAIHSTCNCFGCAINSPTALPDKNMVSQVENYTMFWCVDKRINTHHPCAQMDIRTLLLSDVVISYAYLFFCVVLQENQRTCSCSILLHCWHYNYGGKVNGYRYQLMGTRYQLTGTDSADRNTQKTNRLLSQSFVQALRSVHFQLFFD
jgi:hypothetical protein